MQVNGIGENQVTQVRGFADQRMRKLDAPLDPSNRRIFLIVQYLVKLEPGYTPAAGAGAAAPGTGTTTADAKNLRTRLRLRLLPHRIERVLAAAAVIYGAHDFR
jgi:hypothetical protein